MIKPLIAFLALQVVVCVVDLILPPDMSRAREASAVALDHNGAWLRALPVRGGTWRIRADLERTDKTFIRNLLKVEDERFWWHQGVDLIAIARALGSNVSAGGIVSGGSTITMQTARLLEPKPRNYLSKLIEVGRAWQLEARYSKREILSLYLTLAPYGGNLEGVRAASLSYFGHEPESLTLGEQALLIALPQAPEARRPDRHPERAMAARNLVLGRMAQKGIIAPSQVSEAQTEPMVVKRFSFPALAWHAAGRLAAEAKGLQATVVTTLDAPLQARLETLARQTAIAQGPNSSAAILVIEVKTRAVRASVGSGGLDRAGGWIDMVQAMRSPGSTLKPFIYGFGFEEGIIAPDTRLMDVATRFGDYQPENFDKVFHGEVSAKEALTHSLNVPAVAVLNRIGVGAFESRLDGVGVRLRRPKEGYKDAGLAIALGGAGIKLDDLALLYTGLGDKGLIKPLVWTEADARQNLTRGGQRLMQADAASRVISILRETPPPAGRLPAHLMKTANRPAYKTGTSYGFRDALAVGVAGGYVVLVWTGRPDGGSRVDQTGREASAPLLFDVFDQINAPSQAPQALTPAAAPEALKALKPAQNGASILFPPDKAVVYVEATTIGGKLSVVRGLKPSARGKGPLSWYVNGQPLLPDETGRLDWRPEAEGFYEVSVVDADGVISRSQVRVRAIAHNARP
ncbi:penicillin-binding protein 1C [Asticcacaulis sp. BYS171W]|uniref:peptidoglycan glycosyltransferase n=1 Tax=Asticcacaulis aquaticus TaxID=2984212 RepID=A0ABT5HSR3_9CAUL|nr:penicillin-binding protein 1C [Asticcacaulis aquaticus]MDC7683100.1 penicillin-binding protein 1C [Asticcacaulis aquaticus]